jgi:hypothetical protein
MRAKGDAMNASFDGRPVRLTLQSDRLVLIDPLALDGLRAELTEISRVAPNKQAEEIHALGVRGLRIGLVDVPSFQTGTYEFDVRSFESVDPDSSDQGVFEVDSGTVVVIDMAALEQVAGALTWDRYDALCQSSPSNDSALEALNSDVGGPRFAILLADAESQFSGDGAFRLRTELLRRIA